MYKIKYGVDKTKVTISGSATDQQYYFDIKPRFIDGERVKVVYDNDHLGQFISELDKNVDNRIKQAANCIKLIIICHDLP